MFEKKDLLHYLKHMPTWLYEDVNTRKMFTSIADFFIDCNNTIEEIMLRLNIDKAVGSQLDFIGKIMNVSRSFYIPNLPGYNGKLDDIHYRRLIKGTIAKSKWNGTREGLRKSLEIAFGKDLKFYIEDTQDLSYTIYVSGIENVSEDPATYEPNPVDVALFTSGKYAPEPIGVGVKYKIVKYPSFAFNVQNTILLAGWHDGAWEEGVRSAKQE